MGATVSAKALASRRGALDATPAPLPTPVTQIELSNITANQVNWNSISLQLPAGSVPAGSYPSTITTTVVLGDGQALSSTSNFTVIVAADGSTVVNAPNAQNVLAAINAGTSGVVTIYPAGTVLPNPTPVPTASATPSPAPSTSATASPSASPTASATAAPTATPTLPPTPSPTPTATPSAGADCQSPPYGSCGTAVFSGAFDGGSNAGQAVTATPEPITSNNSAIVLPGQYFAGTVILTLSSYHPGAQQVMEPAANNTNPCPANQLVQNGQDGDTYTLTLNGSQYDLPAEGNGLVGCLLVIGPKAATGSGQSYDQFINIYYPPV